MLRPSLGCHESVVRSMTLPSGWLYSSPTELGATWENAG
jgi:hypothetical protein